MSYKGDSARITSNSQSHSTSKGMQSYNKILKNLSSKQGVGAGHHKRATSDFYAAANVYKADMDISLHRKSSVTHSKQPEHVSKSPVASHRNNQSKNVVEENNSKSSKKGPIYLKRNYSSNFSEININQYTSNQSNIGYASNHNNDRSYQNESKFLSRAISNKNISKGQTESNKENIMEQPQSSSTIKKSARYGNSNLETANNKSTTNNTSQVANHKKTSSQTQQYYQLHLNQKQQSSSSVASRSNIKASPNTNKNSATNANVNQSNYTSNGHDTQKKTSSNSRTQSPHLKKRSVHSNSALQLQLQQYPTPRTNKTSHNNGNPSPVPKQAQTGNSQSSHRTLSKKYSLQKIVSGGGGGRGNNASEQESARPASANYSASKKTPASSRVSKNNQNDSNTKQSGRGGYVSNNSSPLQSNRLKRSSSNKSSINLFNYQTNADVSKPTDTSANNLIVRKTSSSNNKSAIVDYNSNNSNNNKSQLNSSNIALNNYNSRGEKSSSIKSQLPQQQQQQQQQQQFEMEKDFLQKVRDRFHSNNKIAKTKTTNKSSITNNSALITPSQQNTSKDQSYMSNSALQSIYNKVSKYLSKPQTAPTNVTQHKNNTSMNSGVLPNYQSNNNNHHNNHNSNISNYVSNQNVITSSRGVKCIDISVDPNMMANRRGSDISSNYKSNSRKDNISPAPIRPSHSRKQSTSDHSRSMLCQQQNNQQQSSASIIPQQNESSQFGIGENEKTIKPYLNNFVQEPESQLNQQQQQSSPLNQIKAYKKQLGSIVGSRNNSPPSANKDQQQQQQSSVDVVQYDIFREKVMKRTKSSARLHEARDQTPNTGNASTNEGRRNSSKYILDNSVSRNEDKQNSRYSKVNDSSSVNNVSNLVQNINQIEYNSQVDDMKPESLKIYMALKDLDKKSQLKEQPISSPKQNKQRPSIINQYSSSSRVQSKKENSAGSASPYSSNKNQINIESYRVAPNYPHHHSRKESNGNSNNTNQHYPSTARLDISKRRESITSMNQRPEISPRSGIKQSMSISQRAARCLQIAEAEEQEKEKEQQQQQQRQQMQQGRHKKNSKSVSALNQIDNMIKGLNLPINFKKMNKDDYYTPNISANNSQNNSFVDNNRNNSSNNNNNQNNNTSKNNQSHISQNRNPSSLSNIIPPAEDICEDEYLRERLVRVIKDHFKQRNSSPLTSLDYYRLIKMIGKGAFGKVYLGVHLLTGKYVAIKSIEKQYMRDENSKRKVLQEVVILKKVNHKNVIRLLEVFENKKYLFIVLEYASQGDLLTYVKNRGRLDEKEAKRVFHQITKGIQYCHHSLILHRDVKLDNILLDENYNVKVCDFGVSRFIRKGQIINEQCGTPAYIAPEIIRDKGYEGCYADIWSMGVLLYAMVTGTVPFKATNLEDLHRAILSGKFTFPETSPITSEVKDLISRMIKLNPYSRIGIDDIPNHIWFNDLSIIESEPTETPISKKNEEYAQQSPFDFLNGKTSSSASEGLDTGNTIQIIESIVKKVEQLGYPREFIIKSINSNSCNHAEACYYLLYKDYLDQELQINH